MQCQNDISTKTKFLNLKQINGEQQTSPFNFMDAIVSISIDFIDPIQNTNRINICQTLPMPSG